MAHSKLSRCVLSRRAALITSPLFCSHSRTSRTRPGRLRFSMRTGGGYRSPASSRSPRVVVLSTTSSSCSRKALRSSSRPVWGSSLLGSRSGSVGSGPSNVGVPISHLLHSFDTHPCFKRGLLLQRAQVDRQAASQLAGPGFDSGAHTPWDCIILL